MMRIADWRDETGYQALRGHDGAAWAWEFLRRNPDYQREWQAFMHTWEALEAAYGRPPDRDFCAWKNDPRAWVRVSDETAGDCRIDQDKVLIECALGARWGFHKFPPDPRDDDAVVAGRLSWRPREQSVARLVEPGEAGVLDPRREALVRFDLALPLREQLEQAKRALQLEQRRRSREEGLEMHRIRSLEPQLVRELRLLDALAAEAGEAVIERLGGPAVRDSAMARRDGGYLDLPMLLP